MTWLRAYPKRSGMSRLLRHPLHPRRNSRVTKRRQGGAVLVYALFGLMAVYGAPTPAFSQTATPAAPSPAAAPAVKEAPQPSLLTADQMTYDDEQGIVTARGNVELSKEARTVRADSITYNYNTKVVTATGNVRMVEPSGEILFADYAELTDDMRDVFVENIRVLMIDNGRMVGTEGERRGGRMMRVDHAVYTPCEPCAADPNRSAVWQIRAERAVHDNEEHEVRYKGAVLEMFGVPVAYTPYLSQPDPTVERKSGFLSPLLGSNSDLGVFLRTRYYFDIAPDQDLTVETALFSKQGLLLGGEYRKRFERGSLSIAGSVTQSEVPVPLDSSHGRTEEKFRGHIFAKGLFEIDDTWRTGFNIRRASDETYLRKYYDFREDYLTSRVFVEGFRGRNYAAVNAYSWQDLRYGNPTEEPIVAPMAVYNAMGEPGGLLGGRWSLDSGILSLSRETATSTRRLYVQPGWQREIVSNLGFVTRLDATFLAAAYDASRFDRPDISGFSPGSAEAARLFPQGQVTVRYPFVRYGENSQQLIEPTVAFTAAPRTGRDGKIPNEDSQDIEFDQANLFLLNRYPGIDRQDGGLRFTYGLRTAIHGYKAGSANLFLGQSYRFNQGSSFPVGSGLETQHSDYVGHLDLTPAPWLDVNYGFQLDQDTLQPRRHALTASAGEPIFRVSTSYTYLNQPLGQSPGQVMAPINGASNKLEQVNFGFSSKFSERWSLSLNHIQSLHPTPGPLVTGAVLTYRDECLTFQTIARRDFTTVTGDVENGNTIYFVLTFKNLGEFRSPGIGGLFGVGGL